MPTLLEETTVTVDEVDYGDERMQRIIIAYTLTNQENETIVHLYEFYTDDYDESGCVWDEFIELITCKSGHNSIIYNAKRFEGVMCEFAELCLEKVQCAAAA